MRRRRTTRRTGGPARTWVSLNAGFVQSTASTAAVELMSLQAPTTLALTSDPPEDIVIDRIVGRFQAAVSALNATWILALTAQDTTWTPSATFAPDADKRILWAQAYCSDGNGAVTWKPSWTQNTVESWTGSPEMTTLDVTPRVRLEPGKALFLVAYEEAGAATFTCAGLSMRMLFHRAKRSR